MTTDYRSGGKTTLTTDVLLTIARMAALEVEGVHAMAPIKGGVNNLFGRGHDGVRMEVEEGIVRVDLYLVIADGFNIRETGRTVQQHVARAISEMTGLEVGVVDIHVEDIHYPAEA
jgi:uncharacterized alkaline shock family protein YloU